MKQIREAVIVDALRTPVGRKKGKLKDWHPGNLLAFVLKNMLQDKPYGDLVEDVIVGCVAQVGEQSSNIGRSAVLAAGLSEKIPATTLNRQCGSGQQAIHFAAQGVMSGAYDIVVGAGVESMTRVPMGMELMGLEHPLPSWMEDRYKGVDGFMNQFVSAEKIAYKWGITRKDMEELCCLSHSRAARATAEGRFRSQIIPVPYMNENGSEELMLDDEGIRANTNMDTLATLKPVLGERGIVTAALSSQISDAASAVLIMDPETAKKYGLKPRARFVAFDVVGDDPVMMLTAPIPATRRVLEKAGLTIDQIDLFEINEAFASVVLAWVKEFGVDINRVNVNGGALSLGHPLGATGPRLMTTLLNELERTNGRYGLQVMCEGGGLSNAVIIERLD